MTRKEIEKKCREQMQQNIPDKDALWARIEDNLPEQKPALQPKPHIQRSILHRTMAAAACFLFVAAGVSLWSNQKKIETNDTAPSNSDMQSNHYMAPELSGDDADEEADGDAFDYHHAAGDEAEAEAPADAPADAENSPSGMLTYADLDVPHGASIAGSIQTELLGADGQYFSETDVLADTDCFVDVIVQESGQDVQTGEMVYTLEVVDVYGADVPEYDTLYIFTSSPYLLETEHEYVLPLRHTSSAEQWALSYSCAPQIERTRDNQVLCHNGWYSLMNDDCKPVLCDSYGADDFFYDRMYLTGYTELEAFLYQWELGKL